MRIFWRYWIRRTLYIALVISVGLVIRFGIPKNATEAKIEQDNQMSSGEKQSQQPSCIQPHMPVWSKEIRKLQRRCKPPSCGSQEEWVYTKQGRFFIADEIEKKVGNITCEYVAIGYGNNDTNQVVEVIAPMQNGSKLKSDVFKVSCGSSSGLTYQNIHACISRKELPSLTVNRTRYNVFMYGFDSVSRNQMKRMLPNTHKYFTKNLGGHILTGYNILGDGTVLAMSPMFTGRMKQEMLHAMNKSQTKHVDDVLDFVWKRFEDQGYVTQFGEDWYPSFQTFYYETEGFRKQPVHHFLRPFSLEALKSKMLRKNMCIGQTETYTVVNNWLREGLETNRYRPFFTFGLLNEYSHNSNECFGLLDDATLDLIRTVKEIERFNNTFLFLISDHGMRFGGLRFLEIGKLEERTPYFGIASKFSK